MGSLLGIGRGKKAAKYALQGFNYLKENPLIQKSQAAGAGALDALSGALGLGDEEAANQAFEQFQNSTGFLGELRAGERAITGSAAARGKLGSGATLKRLNRFGQDLAQQSYQGFLGNLQGLAGSGQQAALGVGAAGTSGGSAAASSQPQNTGILGRFFGI